MPPQVAGEWERFLETHRDLQPGKNVYPEIFENGWLFPLQRMRETEAMIRLARTVNPRVVMEIGSDKGGSFYHWVKAFSPTKAIAIEIRGIPFADSFPKAFPETQFLFVADSSYSRPVVADVARFLGEERIDCLFIDGDKSAFAKDVAEYLPLVRPGGLVMLHDVQDVRDAQETMRICAKTCKTETILDTSEYDDIEKREKAGLPPADSYEGWFRIWRRTSCGVGVIHV